jgi:hypothetical protein
MKTTPPSISDEGTQCPGSNPHHMAPGKACHPVSPGFRRGLLVPFTRAKSRASSEERATSKGASRGNADGLGWSDADSLIWRFGLPGSGAGVAAAASEMCESPPGISPGSTRRAVAGGDLACEAGPLAIRGQSPPWPLSTWPTGGNAEGFHGRHSSHPARADLFHSLPAKWPWMAFRAVTGISPGSPRRAVAGGDLACEAGPPSEMAMDGISRRNRHFAWFYQAKCAKALFASAMRWTLSRFVTAAPSRL